MIPEQKEIELNTDEVLNDRIRIKKTQELKQQFIERTSKGIKRELQQKGYSFNQFCRESFNTVLVEEYKTKNLSGSISQYVTDNTKRFALYKSANKKTLKESFKQKRKEVIQKIKGL